MAALLSERDILSAAAKQADIGLRLRLLSAGGRAADGVDAQRLKRVLLTARDIARQAGADFDVQRIDMHAAGQLLARAYPDRVARRRSGDAPRYLLSGGRGAVLAEADPLGASPWLAVAELDGNPREARIYLAAPVTQMQVEALFAHQIREQSLVFWDAAKGAVSATRERRFGAILLDSRPLSAPDPERVTALLLEGIRRQGLACLPWTPAARNWQARVLLLRRVAGESWPAVDDAALIASLEDWLAPFLGGCARLSHLAEVPLQQALAALLDYRQQRALEQLAPTHFTVPTGSRLPINYVSGDKIGRAHV